MTKKELSYKEAFDRLQEIQELIEGDQLDVDELEVILKEAVGLLQTCKEKLYKVSEETQKIIQNMQE
ncbi:MAG: exodeoxyribonuclease VII small subunit [Dysgonamonadaceae bacterium]|jgi:exodeoxyribonuclease VII small subunit|nr:exodeoxyribonuclease VII small subunit [Dysgonamonadaceae bacterium]